MALDPEKAIAAMAGQRVAVLGDVIADIYLEGTITRISREAPVPILEYMGECIVLGGAGNAAANVQSLGGQALLIGILGRDEPGKAVRAAAAAQGIDVSGLFSETEASCTKTRILAGGEHTVRQQILRIDRGPRGGASPAAAARFREYFKRVLPEAAAVIVSDYNLDTTPLAVLQEAAAGALAAGRPVVVDSRHRLGAFAGMTLLTPNVSEAEEAVGGKFADERDLVAAGWSLMDKLHPQGLLVTRGPDGMTLFERGGRLTHIPAANRLEVFDVSGAGDTVAAGVTLGLAAGLSMEQSARLANYAAGVAVRKIGTATVAATELLTAVQRAALGPEGA